MIVLGSPFPIRVGTKKKKSNIVKTTVKDIMSKSTISDTMAPVSPVRVVSPILDNSSPLYSPQYVKQTQNMTKNYKNSSTVLDESDYSSLKSIHINTKDSVPKKLDFVDGKNSTRNVLRNEKITTNILSSDTFKNELIHHVNKSKSPTENQKNPVVVSVEAPITKTTKLNMKNSTKPSSPYKFERIQSPIDRSLSPMSPSLRISTTSTYKSTERTASPMTRHSSPKFWNGTKNTGDTEENMEKFSNLKGEI